MRNQRISIPEEDHRVLEFRPRSVGPAPTVSGRVRREATILPIRPDLARVVPRGPEPSGDFRHRMLANFAALGLTVALTAIGFWLASSLADMRRTQDCVLMGRHNCAPIASPAS
jgi:hypothetical protein